MCSIFVLANRKSKTPVVFDVSGGGDVTACPFFYEKSDCEPFPEILGGDPVILEFYTASGLLDYVKAIQEETDAECVLIGTYLSIETGLEFCGIIGLEELLRDLQSQVDDELRDSKN